MNIAIASDDSVKISSHTGRCKGFVIFKIQNKKAIRKDYRENSFTDHTHNKCNNTNFPDIEHNQHSHSSLINALSDCKALITGGIGPRLITDLNLQGIKVYVPTINNVEEAADLFAKGKLSDIISPGSCCHK